LRIALDWKGLRMSIKSLSAKSLAFGVSCYAKNGCARMTAVGETLSLESGAQRKRNP
jgi:hypothetical protein